MAYNFSPKIVTDGLVLYLDAANPKSYNTVNLARNSEALNLWANNGLSGGGISVTANVEMAPDSTLTADTLAQNPSVSGASRWISSTTRTYTAGVTYTLSIWLKKVSGVNTQPTISLWVNGGTLTSVGTITNNWVRYSATFTPVSTISVNTFSGLSVGWGVNGQANDFVFAAWGFQIEIGPVATTYIPSTNTWTDLSKGNYNGTLTNGPTYDTNNYGSIVFDGVDDYVDNIGDTSSFSFIQNTGVFSISFWMKTSNYTVLYYPAGNTPTSIEKGFFIEKSAAGALVLRVFNGDGNSASLINYQTINGVIVDNNWHHITYAVNKNSTTIGVYVDGILKSTGLSIGVWNLSTGNSTKSLNVGRINNFVNNELAGNISSFLIYNRALTAAEIQQNYNTTKTRFGL